MNRNSPTKDRKIAYVQFTNPQAYPPLEHSSRILAEAGWQVLFLGTLSLTANEIQFPPHPKIRLKLLPFVKSSWLQKIAYLLYLSWAIGWILVWKPQWIYASDHFSCPLALILSFIPRLKVLYHEHDTPDHQSPNGFMKIVLGTRRLLIQRADFCVFPNQKRIEMIKKEMKSNDHFHCVWNCPSKDEVAEPKPPFRKGDSLRIFYHGSIVRSRLPISVIHSLAMLPATVSLVIVGYETVGDQGYVGQLKKEASRLGVGNRVEIKGVIPTRKELFHYCHGCDIGLALMPSRSEDYNLQAMAGASNKPFEYLACGLPLLVSQLPDWQEMFVRPGYALACNPEDPQSIAHAINWYLEHLDEMCAMGERGRQRIISEWNYENKFAPILERLHDNSF